MQIVRHRNIEVSLPVPAAVLLPKVEVILSRAQRAYSRLSWAERLARSARPPTAGQVTIKLLGIPESLAASLSLGAAYTISLRNSWDLRDERVPRCRGSAMALPLGFRAQGAAGPRYTGVH